MTAVWALRQANAHKWGLPTLGPLADEPQEMRDDLAAEVRAVIEEMRSPSKAMLHAASKSMSPGKRPTDKWVSASAKHGIRYRAMIDAAISQTKEPANE